LEKRVVERYTPGRRKRERPKKRWVQDTTDELQMSASEARHLAYDRVVFRRVIKGAIFRQEHATE
jgi:hypothetical protein